MSEGLKRADLVPCGLCKKGVMHANSITFFRIKIERFMVNLPAVQRQHGLELSVGSPKLAAIMGPDEDLAERIYDRPETIICDECAMESHCLAHLDERLGE